MNLFRREFTHLAEQFLAVLHRGVVRLVGAEVAPEGAQRAGGLRGVDGDADGERGGGRRDGRLGESGRGKLCGGQEQNRGGFHERGSPNQARAPPRREANVILLLEGRL